MITEYGLGYGCC